MASASAAMAASLIASVALSAPVSAAQDAPHTIGKGPLAAAIERDVDRLVETGRAASGSQSSVGAAAQPERQQWARVIALPPGQEVLLRTDTGIDGRRTVVFADAAELTVVSLEHPALPGPVRKRMREMTADRSASLLAARQRAIIRDGDLSIGAGVISQSGRTLVALNDVLQTIPRDRVRDITIVRTRGSSVGAVAGAAGGIVAGLLTAPYLMMKPCGATCADERFLLPAALVGLPVAGALIGYQPRQSEVVVYCTGPRSD